MAKKKKFVLHSGCFTVDIKKLTINRYRQDKKGGGFIGKVGGFKTRDELWAFVVENEKR